MATSRKDKHTVCFVIPIEVHKKIVKVKSITLEGFNTQMAKYIEEGVDRELKKVDK